MTGQIRNLLIQNVGTSASAIEADGALTGFAFGAPYTVSTQTMVDMTQYGYKDSVTINASLSSAIYGTSNKNQPRSCQFLIIIKS